jgi:hypothetical protein
MKKITLLLVASLLVNLALVALVLTTPTGKADGVSPAADPKPKTAAKNAKPSGIDVSDVDPALWTNLGGEDLRTLVARLRDAGFPPSLVRSIISAQVYESFAAQRKALTADKKEVPFWKVDQPADAKTQAALRELNRAQNAMMRELLGTAGPTDDPTYAAMMRRQYGNLPVEKIEQISRVQQDYSELRQQIYTAAGLGGGGVISFLPEEQAKLALIEKEQKADIAQLLTPQELEDYELRSSNTASQMRYSLSAFKPTEDEFRTIYKLQRAFDEQYDMRSMMATQGTPASQEMMRQRSEAQKQLTAQIKSTLGDERGAEYERATDNNFQQIHRVVERLDLPTESAVQVWTAQKDIEQRANALRQDRTLQPAARNEQLAALAQEANSKVTAAIGERGYQVYRQNGGFWITNLEQASRAGAGPGTAVPVIQGGMIRVGP